MTSNTPIMPAQKRPKSSAAFTGFIKKFCHFGRTVRGDSDNADNDASASLDDPTNNGSESKERLKVKKRLGEAAKTLTDAMSQVSKKLDAHENYQLQHLPHLNDVEEMTRELETTIDHIVDAWQSQAAEKGKALWKDCVKGWFNSVFPYVEPSFNLAQVNTLLSVLSVTNAMSRGLFLLHTGWSLAACFVF
jgi:phenylalanyl-tRNA synthetase alpha subunit